MKMFPVKMFWRGDKLIIQREDGEEMGLLDGTPDELARFIDPSVSSGTIALAQSLVREQFKGGA